MRFNASGLHAIGLAGLLITTTPALAERPAPEIVSGWFEYLQSAGASEAEYGEIAQDGDVTTVDDIKVHYPFSFEFDFGKKAQFSGSFTFTSDEITFEGLSEDGDLYSADAIRVADGSVVQFELDVPEETAKALSGKTPATADQGEASPEGGEEAPAEPVTVLSRQIFDGVEITDTAWRSFKMPTLSPDSKASDLVTYLADAAEGTHTRSMTISRIQGSQTLPDGSVSTVDQKNMRFTDIEGWRIGREDVESYISEQQFPVSGGKMETVKMEMSDLVAADFDFRPVFRALDPKLYEDLDTDSVLGEMSLGEITVTVPSEDVVVSINDMSMTNFGMAAKSGDFLPLIDQALAEKPIDDETFGRAAFQWFSGYSLEGTQLNGLQVMLKGTRVGQLDHLEIGDIDDEGLGTLLVEGVGALNPDNTAQVGLSRLLVGDVSFPTREAIFSLKNAKSLGDIPAMMKAIPTFGRIELDDLVISGANQAGTFELGKYRLLLDKFIGPIPTDITNVVENYNAPLSYISNPIARIMLESLGFETLKLDQNLRIHWDEETQDLEIEQADIALENGGTANLKLKIGGVPRFVFEDPERAQEAVATLSLKSASFLIEDAPAVTRVIEMQAEKANVSPEEIRASLLSQVRGSMGPLADTPFAKELTEAVDAFMQDPDRLEIRIAPENPVPATQLLGMAATSPQAIPELLKASTSAD